MADIDPVKERQRLQAHYASMMDGELENLAGEGAKLTDVARDALRAEIARRGLDFQIAEVGDSKGIVWRKPVTLRKFRDLPEAQLAKCILDTASIPCYLADENLIRMDWFYSNAIGGIKLWVNEEDAEAASALLNAEIPEEFIVEGVGEYTQPRCPKCQSLDNSRQETGKGPHSSGNLVSAGVHWKERIWKCNACGHEWQDDDEEASPS